MHLLYITNFSRYAGNFVWLKPQVKYYLIDRDINQHLGNSYQLLSAYWSAYVIDSDQNAGCSPVWFESFWRVLINTLLRR